MSKVIATQIANELAVQALSTTVQGIVEYRKAAMQIQLETERMLREFDAQANMAKKEHKQAMQGMQNAQDSYMMSQKHIQKQIKNIQKQQDMILEKAISNPEQFEQFMAMYHNLNGKICELNDRLESQFRIHSDGMLAGRSSQRRGRVYDMDG